MRFAAGLGWVDLLEEFFDDDGGLNPESPMLRGAFHRLPENVTSGDAVQQALMYACLNNQVEAVGFLLKQTLDVDAIPPSFDFQAPVLHVVASNGNRIPHPTWCESGHSRPSAQRTRMGPGRPCRAQRRW